MSETTYVPRAGSKAEAAIVALSRTPWMSSADLAVELDLDDKNVVGGYIKSAIDAGAVRRVARDGIAGFSLGPSGEAVPEAAEATAPRKARRRPLHKNAPAPKARQPKPQRLRVPADDASEDNGTRIGVLDDGTVIVFDGSGVTARIEPAVARRIAGMIERLAGGS